MRKIIALSMASVLALSMAACSEKPEPSSSMKSSSVAESSSTAQASSEVESSVSEVSENEKEPVTSEVTDNINTTYTLDNLTAEHLEIFNLAIEGAADIINSGAMTIEELDIQQEGVIEALVYESVLPENGIELFREWKESTGYYAQFSGLEQPSDNTQGSNNAQSGTQGNAQGNNNTQSGTQVPVTPPSSKPTPTEDQKAQQDNGGTIDDGPAITWENKEEIEKGLEEVRDSAGVGNGGGIVLDPDMLNW